MKLAVVTGASSGIGREFVRQISEKYRYLDEIWAVGRDEENLKSLQEACTVRIRPVVLDLQKKRDLEKLRKRLERSRPRIKLLINAAGCGVYGHFADLPLSELRACTRLNCEALISVTHICLPYLRKTSRIIQVASASGFAPQDGFAVYAASKAYVLRFSQALRSELRDQGITVTAVCPGPVDTPFLQKAEKFRKAPRCKSGAPKDPAKVVKQALADAARGREQSVSGVGMKLLELVCRFVPHRAILWAQRSLDGRPGRKR